MSDQIKSAWTWTPLPIGALKNTNLSDGALRLLAALWSYGSPQNTTVFPGVARLAQDIGKTPRATRRLLIDLRKAGWVYVEARPGQSNLYHLSFEERPPDPALETTPDNSVTPDRIVSPPPDNSVTHNDTTSNETKKSSAATAPPPPQDTQDTQGAQPALKANGKPRTAQDDMFDLCAYILYQTTPENQAGMSTGARTNSGRTAKRLLKMNATESLVREWFKWWRNVPTGWNWKGKKGKPDPSDLSDSWSAFMEYRERKQAEARQAELQGQAPPSFMAQVEQIISQQVSV